MSASSPDAKRRVKLYALNVNRQWDDKGTGHVTSCYHEPLDGISLLVRNESDGSLLLESKIQLDTQYQKQQGTLIVWTESDNYDLALSFQERDGCNEIWEKICQVQGRDPSYEQDNDEEQEEVRINLVDCEHDKLQQLLEQITAFSQTSRRRDVLAQEFIDYDYIPKLLEIFRKADESQDLDTLHKLYEIFKQLFLYDRATLTEIMLSEPLLMDVIGVFEYEPIQSNESEPSLQQQEQPQQLVEQDQLQQQQQQQSQQEQDQGHKIEDEQNDQENNEITEIAEKPQQNQEEIERQQPEQQQQGSTDGDDKIDEDDEPNNQENNNIDEKAKQQKEEEEKAKKLQQIAKRKRHREFLKNGTTFKEVIPFGDQFLIDKIHQTYRMQYLQTSVLPAPSILEENAYASLTNILFFNKVEIVSMIQENGEFLQNLFNQIISNETGIERKRELVSFLKEYCIFSQTIQPKQRESFFKTLASLRILSAIEVALSSNDQFIKSAAIDIFTYLVEYSPHMTREHAVQQKEGIIEPPNSNAQTANILKLVIEHITTDQDPELGTATQLSCIIKLLLDPENMPGDNLGKHSFLDFFYYTCMQSLVEPIKSATTSTGGIEPSANDRKTAQLLSIMLELLTFFLEHHFAQLRNYIVNSDLLTRIIALLKSRHKFLVLSVIRFFRRLLGTKDEIYFEIITNEDLFSPIIQVLKNNNGRYNLLDSAILEMFEFIQNEDLIMLMDHILTNFGPFLETIHYVNTFKIMKQKNDIVKEGLLKPSRTSIEIEGLFGQGSRRIWLQEDADVDDVGEVDTDPDRDIDPDSGDAPVDSDSDGLTLPELREIIMNGTKNEDEEVGEVGEDVDDDDEDDIQMDEEDCGDELEPQFKKKKTK